MTSPSTAPDLRAWLATRLSAICALDAGSIDIRERFSRYGLDSLRATSLMAELAGLLGRPLPPTLVWEYPTIEALAGYLAGDVVAPARVEQARAYDAQEPIAIIGMACRFPGAPDLDSFWRLLRDGVDAVSEVPADRGWDALLAERGVTPEERAKVRRGAFLERIDGFDPLFFGISPREAASMDPQQRLLLELCWEGIEDAGLRPSSLHGTQTGVFAGAIWSDYGALLYGQGPEGLSQYTCTGTHHSILANRISYLFGLHGPSLTLDSACSSGLVVVHLACESLRRGESRAAIAGAVNLDVLPESALAVSRFGALSPDGRCYTFDARANGYVRGEGGGVVVLKTLSRALADGDPIRALILGSAVNNDGASNGLTAPNRAAQEMVLGAAYRNAGVRPDEVQYVEAHGTGTPLGDPIEARALGAVLGAGAGRAADAPLLIGSAKTNVGHLEGAAGMVGLAKLVLALQHRLLPPSLHFESPNPHAPLTELGLAVPTATRPWPAPERPLTGGVSSFGLGGTNGHVVVQEWPALGPMVEERAGAAAAAAPALSRGEIDASRGVVFVFPGQGAQWHGMARALLQGEPVFRATIEACDRHIRRHGGFSLIEELTAPRGASRLDAIEVSLPAIISIDIAISAWWRSLGIEPAAVVGHSTGEIAAAHVAGALDLDDTMRVICAYGRFVGRFAGRGGMALLGLPWDEAEGALAGFEGRVFRAIHDSAEGTVVAGEPGALDALLEAMKARGVLCRRVSIDVPPHSPLVDAVREELFEALRGIRPRRGSVPLISEVTGAELDGASLDAGHWVRNFGDPALFSAAIDTLIGRGHRVFLDVGPHPITRHSVEVNLRRAGAAGAVLSSLRRDEDGRGALLETIGALGALGWPVRWGELAPAGDDATEAGAGGEAWVLPVSARSPEALAAMAGAYAAWLRPGARPARLRDVVYTASVRRDHHPRRLAVVGRSREEMVEALASFARGEAAGGVAEGQASPSGPPKVVFVFPGQGSQWVGMGRTLLAEEPAFRAAMEACEALLRQHVTWSLLDELAAPEERSRLDETEVAQPALFAIQVGLAELLRAWGVRPDAVIGHSVGEVAAAHVAGALSLEDAVRLVAWRGRIMQRATGLGKMAWVALPREEAAQAIAGREALLSIAAVNDPGSVVLSGEAASLAEVVGALSSRGVTCRPLRVNYAFHSPQMDELARELQRELEPLRARREAVPFYSTVTGAALSGTELGAAYWARNVRAPVELARAVEASLGGGHRLFVEVGPHPVLGLNLSQCLAAQQDEGHVLCTLRRAGEERRAMLGALGALWVRGVEIDWAALHPAGGRVASLPTYPWQRERCWLDAPASRTAPSRARVRAGGHPLLGEGQTVSTQASLRLWETTLETGRLSWLGDHRVQGAVVLPGAAYLEMALAAGAEALGSAPLVVTDVAFVDALAFAGDAAGPVQVVTTEEQPGRLRFQIASQVAGARGASWRPHARGALQAEERAEAPARLDMAGVRARLGGEAVAAGALYAALGAMGLDYGPAFQGIVGLRRGDGEALGQVRLPEVAGAAGAYQIHPALLDACLQVTAGALLGDAKATWMPVEVGTLRLLRRPSGELWCHARMAPRDPLAPENRRSADLSVVDGAGAPVVEISGLVLQQVASGARRREQDDWFLELSWEPAATPAPEVRAGRFLVLGEGGGLGSALRAALEAAGHTVAHAAAGAPGQVAEGCWPVDDTDAAGVRALLGDAFSGQVPTAVVHLRSLEGGGALDATAVEAALTRGCDSALCAVQALAGMGYRDAPRLWLVTRGAQAVGDSDVAVEQAPLVGLGRTIAMEHPELRCTGVDLDPARPEREVASLLAELLAEHAEQEIALRGGARRVARLVRRTPEEPEAPIHAAAEPRAAIRRDGSYLVTGGLGGLGLSVAGWLAERGAGHLVLVGRSGAATAEQQAAVAALEARGARVTVASADVADRGAIARVLDEVAASGMPLRGVVHAAGLLDDGLLLQQTPARLRKVAAPKLDGALHLHALTRGAPLDFFVLYASVAGLLGSPGQGTYAAANTFLDALAHHRRAQGLPALSVDWGAFSQVGLAAAHESRGARLAARGMRSFTPEEGLSALERLLESGRAQAAVVPLDARQWVELYPTAASSPMLSRLLGERPADERRAAADAALIEQLACADPGARALLLQGFLLREVSRVLRIPEGKIDPSAPLTGLGMDSLMGLELRNRVEVALGTRIPATLLWTYPTVAALCGHLAGELGPATDTRPRQGSAALAVEDDALSDDASARLIEEEFEALS